MSTVKIVENIKQITNGREAPLLDFVRRYKPFASELSKATPSKEPVLRDAAGNRKLNLPDFSSMASVHRSAVRRHKDAKITFQMLPDLKLSLEMVVSLIMSPKDAFNDEIMIRSDSINLLPSSVMQSMLQVVTDYYRKNYNLSEFTQHMLEQTLGYQGALPVIIIPENALDDLINNYNSNLSLESFKNQFDLSRNIPHPINLLGVPDYLSTGNNKSADESGGLKFGKDVRFDLESFDRTRKLGTNGRIAPSSANAYIALSKLMPPTKPEKDAPAGWMYSTPDGRMVDADKLFLVTDNVFALKMPSLREASLESRVAEVLTKSGYNKMDADLESLKETFRKKMQTKVVDKDGVVGRVPTDAEVEALIFKNRRFANTPTAAIRSSSQLKRTAIGEPMIRVLDNSCFIVMSAEGDPTRKLGGYILLDEEGNPLSSADYTTDNIVDLSSYANGNGDFISSMNQRSDNVMNGRNMNEVPVQMLRQFFARTVGEMIDKDLIERAKTGQYPNGVSLTSNDDVGWLMLTRCLKGQRTQFLWIPAEYLVYFAMDYDELGFGKSLLDDIRNLTSMRIMLMVAGIQASLRNSIGRTKVAIKFDEEDPDAQKSFEDIQDEILKSRMNPIPFGVNNVSDISKYLQRSCYEFEISGNSAMPDMEIGFDQYNTQYPKPDEELQNQLKDLSIQHFSLTRDMIDASAGMDFAIQAATNNMMTMKRVLRWQRKVVPQITQHIRLISRNSESQRDSLRDILNSNWENFQINKLKDYFKIDDEAIINDPDFKKLAIEQCLNEFINNLYTELPSPAATTLETQKQMMEDAAEFYKSALEYIVNESFFDTSVQGEGLADHVDMLKNILLSHFMRDFMAKNAILPELSDLTTLDEDGKVGMNVMDSLEKHIKALGMSTGNFFSRFKEFSIKQTAIFQDLPDSSTTGTTDTGGGSDGGDDYGGGSGDFNDDMGDFPSTDDDLEPEEDTANNDDAVNDDANANANGNDDNAPA